jgi:hypothetical protein
MVHVVHVEVALVKVSLLTRKDNFEPEPLSESGFKINTAAVAGHLCDYESRFPDLYDDLVNDVAVVLTHVDRNWDKAGFLHSRLYPYVVGRIEVFMKPSGNESLLRFEIRSLSAFNLRESVGAELEAGFRITSDAGQILNPAALVEKMKHVPKLVPIPRISQWAIGVRFQSYDVAKERGPTVNGCQQSCRAIGDVVWSLLRSALEIFERSEARRRNRRAALRTEVLTVKRLTRMAGDEVAIDDCL